MVRQRLDLLGTQGTAGSGGVDLDLGEGGGDPDRSMRGATRELPRWSLFLGAAMAAPEIKRDERLEKKERAPGRKRGAE